MTPVVIALGANLGDRRTQMVAALGRISQFVRVERVSSLYESAPMYLEAQPSFYNAVLTGHTKIGPYALLKKLKAVEHGLGRRTREANGPRELDLDIILYGALLLRSARLWLPHPRAAERRFVLLPLVEIAPDAWIPGWGSALELLRRDEVSQQDVQKVADADVPFRRL
ncbi:MAG: 2-amino-4-hydroxy-6-hydroxymethyldihydropteridine diphosphokinase [Fimbriimonadaceae bacterium]|nr:2-amino-4-hydroxy-6-hydroxymethyldihydropteridine diphosphokinase [Fimbriimonadaceae bacterium]QYK56273.1 MAG: 2-amino-4-hydroxy-6-hydroxymethyldihydropteridine diphosphokinase [Fimbriimonadaceae bacterium]